MFFLEKIFWLTRNTFREAVRQKFFSFILLVAAALTLVSIALTGFDFGSSELKFIADFGFGGIFLFGSVLAVVMTVQIFFTEFENRTALTLLAKPVRRSEFVLGKFFGIWILLGVFVVLMCAILAAVLAMRWGDVSVAAEARGLPQPYLDLSGIFVFAVFQWLRLGIVAAMTAAISSFAQTNLYAVIVSFCGLLVGQLQYVFREFADSEKTGFAVKTFSAVLTKIVPDLQLFNAGEALVLDPAGLSQAAILGVCGNGVLWIAVLAAIAIWFFRFREI